MDFIFTVWSWQAAPMHIISILCDNKPHINLHEYAIVYYSCFCSLLLFPEECSTITKSLQPNTRNCNQKTEWKSKGQWRSKKRNLLLVKRNLYIRNSRLMKTQMWNAEWGRWTFCEYNESNWVQTSIWNVNDDWTV